MARKLPKPLDKSEMLYGKAISTARANEIASTYAVSGRLSEAADFYQRAGNEEALLELAERAVAGGNLFLLARVERALGRPFEPDRWRALAISAVASGRKAYAIAAYRRAGDDEEADRLAGRRAGTSPDTA